MSPPAAIVILALARNCEEGVARLRRLALELHEAGWPTAVYIGENGSTDKTVDEIYSDEWQAVRCHRVDVSRMAAEPNRLNRMAVGRELVRLAALEEVKRSELVIVCDTDGVLPPEMPSEDLIEAIRVLKNNADIYAVAANSRPYYYDVLAYKSCQGFVAKLPDELRKIASVNPLEFLRYYKEIVFPLQRRLTRAEFHVCESAFNGLCLYESKALAEGTYMPDEYEGYCEHLRLNAPLSAKWNKRVAITGHILLTMPPEHGPEHIAAFALRSLTKGVREIIWRKVLVGYRRIAWASGVGPESVSDRSHIHFG
jgi:hypothetical protein